jgi:hypothetical protein
MKGIIFFLLVLFFLQDVRSQEVSLNNNYSFKNLVATFKNENAENYYGRSKAEAAVKSTRLQRIYAKVYGSYGFITPGSYSVQSTNNFTYYDKNGDQHDTTIQSQGKKGVGGGVRAGLGIGYVLNDFVNLGIDAEYLVGAKLTNTLSSSSDTGHFNSSTNDRMKYNAITLSPHIIFKALAKPKYFIYNKLGILLTLPYALKTSGSSTGSWSYNWNPSVQDSTFKATSNRNSTYDGKYKISLGLGFNVGFGVNFRVSNHLRIFGELFGNFSALSPSSSELITTTHQANSVYNDNQLGETTENDYSVTNTKYEQEGLTISHLVKEEQVNGGRMLTYSGQEKKFTVNMNSMGIAVGIIGRF